MAFECCSADRRDPRLIGLVIYETSRAWRCQLDEQLKPLGISMAMWTVVWHLAQTDEPMTQRALANAMSVEGSSIVRLLDRLEQGGWVRRESVCGDRRCKRVMLTDKVLPLVEQFEQVARDFTAWVLEGIPEDKLRTCSEVLLMLKRRLDAASGLDLPHPLKA